MFKNGKGFTLVELLIVIAVIGIIASVILVSTSSARTKAQLAAFKTDTRGSYAGLANACTTTGLPIAVPMDTKNTNWAAAYTVACGSNGNFTITATPINASIVCTATVKESGVTYSGAGC